MSDYRFFLLGGAHLTRGGQPLDLDTRKAVALLAFLALGGRPQSRDILAALLWPESGQSEARGALRRTLSTLRKILPEEILDAGREAISLDLESGLSCDALVFRETLQAYRLHQHQQSDFCQSCFSGLRQAAALYRGDFMAGFSLRDSLEFDNWQFQEAEQFRREYAEVLDRLIRMLVVTGELESAIDYAQKLLALDPLNESAHRSLIMLHARAGRREAAFRQYRECLRILEEELGVEPLEETTRLIEDIRSGRFVLETPASGVFQPAAVQDTGGASVRGAPPVPVSAEAPGGVPEGRLPLVGRSPQMSRLQELYSQAAPTNRFILLSGEPGIGKTRLAEEFLSWVQAQGGRVLRARCYQGETGLSYGAIVDAVRSGLERLSPGEWGSLVSPQDFSEAARLLPELERSLPGVLPASPIDDGPGARLRFYESLSRLMLALLNDQVQDSPPGVLFLDDLHWVDNGSLGVLTYLVHRLAAHRLIVLCTWWTGSRDQSESLNALLADAIRRNLALTMELDRLDGSQIDELLLSIEASGVVFPPEWRSRLAAETEGLPLFLVAYLHAALRVDTSPSRFEQVPASVRDIMQMRLTLLEPTSLQLLQAAAAIGRSFDFETLQEACGRSEEEMIVGLEELAQRALIREVGFSPDSNERHIAYDFGHEQMRLMVYESTSLARRRLLHRRVADSLVQQTRLSGANHAGSALSSQIAYHYRRAGQTQKAAEYYLLAGEYSRRLYDNAEAIDHFKAALALGEQQRAYLHAAIGDLETLNGNYAAAIRQYETAAAYSDSKELMQIERSLGLVYDRLGDFPQAIDHYQAALTALETLIDPGSRAHLLADWSLACYRSGDLEEAAGLAKRAMLEIEGLDGQAEVLAQIHNLSGILARGRGEFERARQHLESSLALAEQMGSLPARTAALNNLALVFGDLDEHPRAIEAIKQALVLCSSQRDRHREAAIRNNLADLLQAAGEHEEARQQVREAVRLFAEIGLDVGQWQPEIWKLVEW